MKRKELEVSFLRIVAQHLQDLARPHREVKVMQLDLRGMKNRDCLIGEEKNIDVFWTECKRQRLDSWDLQQVPKAFCGGSRESFCLILFLKKPNSLISMYAKSCNGHIFLLYEQKDSQFIWDSTEFP